MLTEDMIYKYAFLQQSGIPTQTFSQTESGSKVWDAKQLKDLEVRIKALEKKMAVPKVGVSVLICDLNNPKYSLKKPFSLLVFVEGSEYCAAPIDFDIFGVGEDEKSAIDDLKKAIISYFDSLSASKSKLSDRLKAKFTLLQSFISHET